MVVSAHRERTGTHIATFVHKWPVPLRATWCLVMLSATTASCFYPGPPPGWSEPNTPAPGVSIECFEPPFYQYWWQNFDVDPIDFQCRFSGPVKTYTFFIDFEPAVQFNSLEPILRTSPWSIYPADAPPGTGGFFVRLLACSDACPNCTLSGSVTCPESEVGLATWEIRRQAQ